MDSDSIYQSPVVALDRPNGTFEVSSDGKATYSFPLELPPGTGEGNTPILSLEHRQGNPNGLLGQGWILGGLSSIQRAPINLAIDGFNAPITYNPDGTRFALDGQTLIVISGEYGSQGAVYEPEIYKGQKVTTFDQGFWVSDGTGRIMEYGTTSDSRAMSNDGTHIREWRLNRNTDVHGNSMIFQYTTSPRISSDQIGGPDKGTTYLNCIMYTSNTKASPPAIAKRAIDFFYSPRNDSVVVTGAGDILEMNHRLTRIALRMQLGEDTLVTKAYLLDYSYSPVSEASQLSSIKEQGADGTFLNPTTMTYSPPQNPALWFKPTASPVILCGDATTNIIGLLPLNVRGKALSDIGLIQQIPATNVWSIKTFLATIDEVDEAGNSSLSWQASMVEDGCRNLTPAASGTPIPLITDLSGDGQNDIVMAFNSGSGLKFSISRCTSEGFAPYTLFDTSVDWNDNDKFFAMDCDGNGRIDIVQICSIAGKIAFRSFFSRPENGGYSLGNTLLTQTSDSSANTMHWFPMDVNRDGLQDLVRVWYEELDSGLLSLKATAYVSVASATEIAMFKKMDTTILGEYLPKDLQNLTVIPCDINADGIQDIVTCHLRQSSGSDTQLQFTFSVFLCDGAGGLVSRPSRVLEHLIIGQTTPIADGEFQVMDLDGTGLPSIVYLYRDFSGCRNALISQGNYSGSITNFLMVKLAGRADVLFNQANFVAVDLNGSGKAGWFAWTSDGSPAVSVTPFYNIQPLGDVLSSITDPLGLCTTPTYRPLSLPSVYKPSPSDPNATWTEALRPASSTLPNNGPFVSVLGIATYVVSQLRKTNVSSRNAFPCAETVTMFYEGARIDLGGRGWQGFSRISSQKSGTTSINAKSYLQDWPVTGYQTREDNYTAPNLKSWLGTTSSCMEFPDLHAVTLMRSQTVLYQTPFGPSDSSKIYMINKVLDQVSMYESGIVAKLSGTEYTYDTEGFLTSESLFNQEHDESAPKFQLWKLYSYTSFDAFGVKGVPLTSKVTSSEACKDKTTYEAGDLSFVKYEYDDKKCAVTHKREWSTFHDDWQTSSYEHDDYGNQISYVDIAGLTETTTYDSIFHSFPLEIHQQGDGVDHLLYTAFDTRFGTQVADIKANGQVSLIQLDAFGRTICTWLTPAPDDITSAGYTSSSVPPYVIGCGLIRPFLDPSKLVEVQRVSYAFTQADGADRWPSRTTTLETISATSEKAIVKVEYFDCKGMIPRVATSQGAFPQTWIYRRFDQAGNTTSESVPLVPPENNTAIYSKLTWFPESDLCKESSFDALQRPLQEIQPRPKAGLNRQQTKFQYGDGGNRIIITVAALEPENMSRDSLPLSRTEVILKCTAGESQNWKTSTSSQSASQFTYNSAGYMNVATDPSGKKDITNYNLQGLLLSSDNVYQNPKSNMPSGERLARTYDYDIAGRLIKEINTTGETTVYRYDAKGRTVMRVGSDDRTIRYTYDGSPNGIGKLTSVLVSKPGSAEMMESSYDFFFDARGRPISTLLSLDVDGTTDTYEVKYTYDLQDQLLSKRLPDGTLVNMFYSGKRLVTSSMLLESPSILSRSWGLEAVFPTYDAYDNCTTWELTGSEAIEASYGGAVEYDNIGRPTSRALNGGTLKSSLVHELYTYDDLGRLTQCDELESSDKFVYSYKDQRLASSQQSDTTATFEYDDSGNLKGKNGIRFSYNGNMVIGTNEDDHTVFEAEYDDNGRMTRRLVNTSGFSFQYDGFGKMSHIKNETTQQVSSLLSDFLGRKLVQSYPDGTKKINISSDYHVTIKTNGSRVIERFFYGTRGIMATVSSATESASTTHELAIYFSNTKGNITHKFDKSAVSIIKFVYDPFGQLLSPVGINNSHDLNITYESQNMHLDTGLLDFGARCYDPLLGRFTTPDDQWSSDPLAQVDVMNRYAFENNDPINNADPTGHWSWGTSIIGLLAATALVVAAVIITAATAGTGSLLAAAVIGGLAGEGFAGIGFSIANKDIKDPGKFWGGWFANVGVGMVTGVVTGFAVGGVTKLALGIESASSLASAGRYSLLYIVRPAIVSGGSVIDQLAFNGFDQAIMHNKDTDLRGGLALAAVSGFVFGGLGSLAKTKKVGEKLGDYAYNTVTRSFRGLSKNTITHAADLMRSTIRSGFEELADAINMLATVEPTTQIPKGPVIWTGKYLRKN
ncbi:hypothetical protein MMC11_005162 [Xylographa trunciseda]|nr:hypothetical protein [Xylographa trunciseda]